MNPQTITISDRRELYRCYMPFIKGGGLFFPFNEEVTPNKVSLGQNVFILFSMLEKRDKHAIHGKVVWLQRQGMNKGYGIAFGDSTPMKALKDAIEENVSDYLIKKDSTYTL